jgi:predicted ATPase/DNA-binding SARP family transcriptional activator/Flp pilus assembly protein TadD
VEFRILGSLEVDDLGRPLDLGGLRERALLVRLLLSANHVVSADRLAEDLWSGQPPPHSMATLRVYISRLRRVLGPASSALVTHPPGYQLNIGAEQLDVTRFERLVEAASTDRTAGDPQAAAAGLRSALSLWRGPALSDVADLAFARADSSRLEEARLTALEDRVDADLACGRHAILTAELDGLVASQPLRERLCALRILALYRCGRQADALHAYQQLRTRLAEELGIDPTPKLRQLQTAILRQDRGLDWSPMTLRPGGSGGPAGSGGPGSPGRPGGSGERGGEDHAGGPGRNDGTGWAPGDAAGAHRGPVVPEVPAGPRLPAESTSFIGREDELSTMGELLGLSRMLTLTGPGGSGKSRLALRSGARLAERHPDGVWLIQLAPVTRPELVMPAVAAALYVREEPGRQLLDSVTARFLDRTALLIVDNCEHVLDAAAAVIAAVLSACPAVRILATSQSRLHVGGEASWPVPPLTLPGADERDPASALQAESVRLFCDRAALARPGFRLTADNAAAVSEICRRLDGIPLAVELAAARVSVLTAGQLSARLDDRFRVLTGGSRTGLPRHRTLEAALEWSHDLLSATEQVCLRRMAIFAGGCTIDAAEAVCADRELPRHVVFETVTSLVDRSLLTIEERSGSMRYGMLESIRQYAQLRLDAAGERAELSRRHLGWLLEFAGQAGLDGSDQGAWLDLLDAEHGNFVAALEWSLSAPVADAGSAPLSGSALALAGALAPFWVIRGYSGLGRGWLDAALAVAGPGADQRLRAIALDGAGQLASVQADHDAQRAYQLESVAIWRDLGDEARLASCLGDLGSAAHIRGEYPAAEAIYTEALELSRRAADAQQMARSLSGLGRLALHRGDLARATTCYQESMASFRAAGDLRRVTLILGNLGVVALHQGDFELARTRFEEHLSNARTLGDRKLIAGTLTNLGMVAMHLGDLDGAERLHREALDLTQQIGDRRLSSVALTNLGVVAYTRKDFPAAVVFHRRSLALAETVGELRSIAESLEELAEAESAMGHMQRAAGLFGASLALREEIGAPIPGPDLVRFDEAAAATAQALGAERFASARDAGRELTVAAAIEFANSDADALPVGSRHGDQSRS